jgi:hypothetical protein
MARPLKEISEEQFDKLCGIQCTLAEIANFFNCSEDTIENWCKRTFEMGFSDIYKQKRGGGRVSLRRKQMEVAMSGNVAMLIFLGKQYLGQSDKTELSTADNKPFELAYKLEK